MKLQDIPHKLQKRHILLAASLWLLLALAIQPFTVPITASSSGYSDDDNPVTAKTFAEPLLAVQHTASITSITPLSSGYSGWNEVTDLTAETFAEPPMLDWPWVRWNFTPSYATVAELETELEDMYEAGIAGVEIGQGGAPTDEQLEAILRKANNLGLKVSLKAYTGAPAAYPTTGDYVRKTLNNTKVTVDAGVTYSGALSGTGTIVAVLAYRCTANPCPTSGIIDLDRSSVLDLTSTITGTNTDGFFDGTTAGTISWTAPATPADAQWLLIAFRATALTAQAEVFSRQGTNLMIDGYEDAWTSTIKDLLRKNGGDIFVDSHATDPFGAPQDLWSSNMANDFEVRAGYDLIPNLAALFNSAYSFSDGSTNRIFADFDAVRTDLFVENRIIPMNEWAHNYNLTLRLQAEDFMTTSIPNPLKVVNYLERPEHESLISGDQTDIYRTMASVNHMNGNPWYSTECCAALQKGYVETFQDSTVRMNRSFAGGMTKQVYHFYGSGYNATSTWPGFTSFGAMFSNTWNRTNPFWIDAKMMNDYQARNHQVLTQGRAKVDLAVYMHNYAHPRPGRGDFNRYWADLDLQQAGYTWDYLDETLLNLPNAIVTDNRLAADGPDYKALIFDSTLLPTYNTAYGKMTLVAARKFLSFAQQGLPIIIVGTTPTQVPGYAPDDDTKLQAVMSELVALDNVYTVSSEADVPVKLAELGIDPAAKPGEPATLLSQRRYDEDTKTDYYFLFNQSIDQVGLPYVSQEVFDEPAVCRTSSSFNPCVSEGDAIDQYVTFEGQGTPYLLDTWTGEITPIAEYTSDDEHATIRIQLGVDASKIIAISNQANRFDVSPTSAHVISTTADSVVQSGATLMIRDTKAGAYQTQLSDGTTFSTTIETVPEPIDLTNVIWHLSAEDWQPTYTYGITGTNSTATTKVPIEVELSELKPWPDIPELQYASGVGTYSTTVTLPSDWDSSYGATLSLGQVVDTFILNVNGQDVVFDQVQGTADLNGYLQAGDNEIVVRVATTLNNRLYGLGNSSVVSRGLIQEYGLVGPVILTPYRQVSYGSSATTYLPLIMK